MKKNIVFIAFICFNLISFAQVSPAVMEEEIDAEEMYQKGVSFYLGNNGMTKDYENAVE